MAISKKSSKYNIFARKLQFNHMLLNEDGDDAEDIRNRSSQLLEERTSVPDLASSSTATNTNDSMEFKNNDYVEFKWGEDQELSNIEQEQLKQQRVHHENTSSSGNDWRRKIKRLKFLKRSLELARRKTFDKKGSFDINMVTYRDHKNEADSNICVKGNDRYDRTNYCPKSISIKGIGCDDRSGSSASTYVSNDFTLQVIDEDISYFNT